MSVVYDPETEKDQAPKPIADKESGPSRAEKQEQDSLDKSLGGGFFKHEEEKPNKDKKGARRFLTKKNALFGGIGAGVFGGGILGILLLGSGPLQFLQLGNAFSKFDFPAQSVISKRFGAFSRSARAAQTGDIGETRVSYLGSRRFHKVETQLKNQGIEFRRTQVNGRPTSITIEAAKNADFKGSTLAESRARIAKFYDIPEGSVRQVSGLNGGKFSINVRENPITTQRSLVKSSLKSLGDGKIIHSIRFRTFAKFFELPSVFHPIKKTRVRATNALQVRSERIARENQRKGNRRAQLKSRYANAKTSVSNRIAPHRTAASSALLFTAATCIIRDIGNKIPLVNYAEVVVPSMTEAVDKKAIAGQIESSELVSPQGLADASAALVDADGNSVWDGQALNALTNNTAGEGIDIDEGYRQAFFSGSTGNALIDAATDNGASALACSTAGQIIQGAAGLVLLATGPGGWAAKASTAGVQAVVLSAAISFISDLLVDSLTEDDIESFAGPAGGNLMAYGARAASNQTAMTMGGVALSETEERILMNEYEKRELEDFKKKSLFARVFDATETKSIVGTMARNVRINPSSNVASLFSSLNPATLLQSTSSIFTGKVAAAGSYDWGFPLYGVPSNLVNDPRYEDPFENAEQTASILEGSKGDDYIERAKKCFGVDIKQTDGRWDVIPESEVNPTENEYPDNCDDIADRLWSRIIMFTLDTGIINTIECYEGDTALCRQGGVETLASSSSSSTATTGTLPEGTVTEAETAVTQQGDIRVHKSIVGKVDEMVAAAAKDGLTLTGGGWRSPENQIRLRKEHCGTSDYDIYQKPAGQCSPPTAKPGSSNHEKGLAIDFRCNGASMGSRSSPCFTWLSENAARFGFKNLPSEPWHWSVDGK